MTTQMFSTLAPSQEGRRRRGAAFICGLFAEALFIGTAILFGMLFPQELPLAGKQYALVWLPFLRPPAQHVVKPPLEVARVAVPKVQVPAVPHVTLPQVAKLVMPKLRATVVSVPERDAPQPSSPSFPVVRPRSAPKVEMAVVAGVFGGAPLPPTTKRPASQVQTGGFGDPQGFPGRAQGGNPGNVPKLGSFGLPEGPGVGNGTGGARGIPGVVASAGFGNGTTGSGYGRGTAPHDVAMGGFETVAQVASIRAKNLPAARPVEFLPVEIFSKPTPVYTEEARHLGIQGDVALSVVFEASGAIRVIGIVKSLGHGLDQAAVQAAAQIRFKPARRDGKPADFPATLLIEFRLADQST